MALTEVAVRSAKPSAKDTKLFDERGLPACLCERLEALAAEIPICRA